MFFRTRRRDDAKSEKTRRRRVRKSRQKEAAGAADAGPMQIEWSEAEGLKLGGVVKAAGVATDAPVQRRVDGGSGPSRGQEEIVQGQRRHTSPRRCEARQCSVWASDFMQPWPGAVENGVGVVPP